MPSYYDQFKERMTSIADINHAAAVLHWDKETYLPPKGAAHRSQQLATLSALAHEKFTDPKFGRLLNRLEKMTSLSPKEAKNVAVARKDFDRATRFTEEFVRNKSMAVSNAYHAWIRARQENNYELYIPALQALIDIVREEAEIIGYSDHPYDACLDLYEPDMTVARLDPFFAKVREDLLPLIREISAAEKVNAKFLENTFPRDVQWDFGMEVLANIGYDFEAGRQDISEHPFTISFSPGDVRVTTRIDEQDLLNMTWSCIHEGGHALYEQGLPVEEYGLASGSAVSLAIHESQSRLWENNVGRSNAYLKYIFPILQNKFPKQLKKVNRKRFYQAINQVRPNLIRTEADELHYHFHVAIRYEIEKAILEGQLQARDLKNIWNEKYRTYFEIEAPDDKRGILQDIHWSHGSFGYFPTYSLGSFYAAQFFAAAEKAIPKLKSQLAKGKTQGLLSWLRENIHQHGRTYEAEELCEMVTGEKLNTNYFIEYAIRKYGEIYSLQSENKEKNKKKKKSPKPSKKKKKNTGKSGKKDKKKN